MARTPAAVGATVGSAVVLVGSFLPWLASGERRRSSYELARLARRLDFATGPVARVAVTLWPLVPMAVVGVAVASWLGWRRPAALGALGVAAYVAVICVVAWRAPLPAQPGIAVTFLGAVLVGVSGAMQWRRARL